MKQDEGTNIMSRKQLPKAQAQFVENMADPAVKNQTQAYMKAYHCTYDTARANAPRLLANACISDAIAHRKQRAIAHSRVTPEEVLGNAAFQMRSSIDDVLDDEGSFDIRHARETGAIDLVKKHKETVRTINKQDGGTETIKTVEVEMLTNQDGRKEVANYIGLEKFAEAPAKDVAFYVRLIRGYVEETGEDIKQIITTAVEFNRLPADMAVEVERKLLGTGEGE